MKLREPLKLYMIPDLLEAGCDEAGRGCLAGPVFAAAVILPPDFICANLNDSKQLSHKQRYELRQVIEEKAISFSVASCSPQEIDELNILWASVKAMHRALEGLSVTPDHIVVDGNRFRTYKDVKHSCVVKGDSKFQSIAAASILAKTYRDDYMIRLDESYPEYDWTNNKGYPTKKHKDAIRRYGVTDYHRKSFNLVERQLELFL